MTVGHAWDVSSRHEGRSADPVGSGPKLAPPRLHERQSVRAAASPSKLSALAAAAAAVPARHIYPCILLATGSRDTFQRHKVKSHRL